MAKTKEEHRQCSTEGCENPAKLRFERGGVGSDYCPECYAKIDLDAPPQPDALTVLDQLLDDPAPEAEGATGAASLEDLERILNDIGAATAHGAVPDDLHAKLGATGVVTNEADTGVVTVSILGVTAGSAFGLHRALLDWCMAASRAIMAGRAAE